MEPELHQSESDRSQQVQARSQAPSWGTTDYAAFASTMILVGEVLCESVDLRAGQKVLDVATGTGNAALAAARRFCDAVGVDLEPILLARGRRRADTEGLPVTFVVADAESLPFPDN